MASCLFFNSADARATATMDFTRTNGQPYSAGCWFKTSSTPGDSNGYSIMCTRTGSTSGKLWKIGLNQNLTTTFVYDSTGGGTSVSSPLTYSDGIWHHAVGVYDGSTVLLYMDGVLVANSSSTFTTANLSTTQFAIGIRPDTLVEDFVGYIDEAFVSSNALTAGDVDNIYHSAIPLSRLTHLWKMDEGSGSTLNDEKATLSCSITGATYVSDEHPTILFRKSMNLLGVG